MSTLTCNIPEHAWLVLGLDDLLDELDPMNLTSERPRAHEYLPEIPDIIGLMVQGEVDTDDVLDVFEGFFGHMNRDNPQMTYVVHRINELRTDWLALLGRIERTWKDSGLLWSDIHISDFAGNGDYFAMFQDATVPGVDHESRTFENCTGLEDAVEKVLAYDRQRHQETSRPDGNPSI